MTEQKPDWELFHDIGIMHISVESFPSLEYLTFGMQPVKNSQAESFSAPSHYQ